MNKYLKVAAAALVIGALALPSPALAAGHDSSPPERNCVSNPEFHSLVGLAEHTDRRRETIEARWDVRALGRVRDSVFGSVMAYRRCGYLPTDSYAFIGYDKGRAWVGGIVRLGRHLPHEETHGRLARL